MWAKRSCESPLCFPEPWVYTGLASSSGVSCADMSFRLKRGPAASVTNPAASPGATGAMCKCLTSTGHWSQISLSKTRGKEEKEEDWMNVLVCRKVEKGRGRDKDEGKWGRTERMKKTKQKNNRIDEKAEGEY